MRLALLVPALAAAALLTAPAAADVGPPPSCGAGTHHEYLYGHRCVPDGSHLEPDPAGGVRTVPDGAKPTPTAAPAPTAAPTLPPTNFASPPPAPSAQPGPVDPQPATPPPAAAPPSRGCACAVTPGNGATAGIVTVIAAAIGLLRRRRSRRPG